MLPVSGAGTSTHVAERGVHGVPRQPFVSVRVRRREAAQHSTFARWWGSPLPRGQAGKAAGQLRAAVDGVARVARHRALALVRRAVAARGDAVVDGGREGATVDNGTSQVAGPRAVGVAREDAVGGGLRGVAGLARRAARVRRLATRARANNTVRILRQKVGADSALVRARARGRAKRNSNAKRRGSATRPSMRRRIRQILFLSVFWLCARRPAVWVAAVGLECCVEGGQAPCAADRRASDAPRE